MAEEIATQLGRQLDLVRTGVLRSNLRLEVHQLRDNEAKLRHLLDLCQSRQGSTSCTSTRESARCHSPASYAVIA